MPRGLIAFLDRPWGVALALLGAFVLPLLLADLLGGGGDVQRSVALVTTVDSERAAAPAPAQTAAIADLRPTRALPRLAPAAGGDAAPAPAAPPAAAPPADDEPAEDEPAAPTAGPASAPAPAPAPAPSPAPSSGGGGGGTGSFENSGTGSGSFEDSD